MGGGPAHQVDSGPADDQLMSSACWFQLLDDILHMQLLCKVLSCCILSEQSLTLNHIISSYCKPPSWNLPGKDALPCMQRSHDLQEQCCGESWQVAVLCCVCQRWLHCAELCLAIPVPELCDPLLLLGASGATQLRVSAIYFHSLLCSCDNLYSAAVLTCIWQT